MALARMTDILLGLLLFCAYAWWFAISLAPETERMTWTVQHCEVSRAEVVSTVGDLRADGLWVVHVYASWESNGQRHHLQQPWVFREHPEMSVTPVYFDTQTDAHRLVTERFAPGTEVPCYGQDERSERRALSKPSLFQGVHLMGLWLAGGVVGGLLLLSALYIVVAPYWFTLGAHREVARWSVGLQVTPPLAWVGIPLRDGGMYLRSTSRAFVHTVATLTTIVCLYGSYSCIWMSSDGAWVLWSLGVLLFIVGCVFGLLLMGHVLYEHRIALRASELSVQGFFGVPLTKQVVLRKHVKEIQWMRADELDERTEAGLYVLQHNGDRMCIDDTSPEEVQRWLYALVRRWAEASD